MDVELAINKILILLNVRFRDSRADCYVSVSFCSSERINDVNVPEF